jgi:hypothetical protein
MRRKAGHVSSWVSHIVDLTPTGDLRKQSCEHVITLSKSKEGAGIVQSVLQPATVWMAGVRFPTGTRKVIPYSTEYSPTLRPALPSIQWVPGSLSLGKKRQGREAHRSPPSSGEAKNFGAISPLPNMS